MSAVIGGIGISHTPSMGYQYDRGQKEGFEPRWKEWFEGLQPVKRWLAELAPSKMIVIYNDHLNHFKFDAYPTFAVGMGQQFPQADEGRGLRPFPPLEGDPAFAWPVVRSLVNDGFDLTFCQELEIDHGIYSWLPYVMDLPWDTAFLPIAVNMIMQPLPTPERLYQLGKALRKAVEHDAGTERVLIVGTGGMSHQIHGTRFGLSNRTWDRYFLDHIAGDFERLRRIEVEKIAKIAGTEAVELTMWYAMRAALSQEIRTIHTFHTVPEVTGCGVIALEETHAER